MALSSGKMKNFDIKANVSDPAGNMETVHLYASRQLLTEIGEAPYEYTWEDVPAGRYMLRLDGVDAGGNTISSSSSVQITAGDVPLPDTLVHHWSFDEGSGDMAYNSVNIYDGIIHGASWTVGKYGNALEFDGNSDYVEISHNAAIDFQKDVTIAAWIYLV